MYFKLKSSLLGEQHELGHVYHFLSLLEMQYHKQTRNDLIKMNTRDMVFIKDRLSFFNHDYDIYDFNADLSYVKNNQFDYDYESVLANMGKKQPYLSLSEQQQNEILLSIFKEENLSLFNQNIKIDIVYDKSNGQFYLHTNNMMIEQILKSYNVIEENVQIVTISNNTQKLSYEIKAITQIEQLTLFDEQYIPSDDERVKMLAYAILLQQNKDKSFLHRYQLKQDIIENKIDALKPFYQHLKDKIKPYQKHHQHNKIKTTNNK